MGLATSVRVFNDESSMGTEPFVVFSLTETGRAHPGLVMEFVYAYLATVRRQGVDKKLSKSLSRVAQLEWDWSSLSSPSTTVQTLAEKMTRLPVDNLLSGDSLICNLNVSLVSDLLASLTPENMNVAYLAPADTDEGDLFGDLEVLELPHYGVKHIVGELEKIIMRAKLTLSWYVRG